MSPGPLAPEELRVVRFDLRSGDWAGVEAWLDAAERERAARFRFDKDREQYVRSHAGLRRALAEALATEPSTLEFVKGPHNKPELADRKLRFSLSHAGGLALVAISNRAVGVDLELLRDGPEREVGRFLSPAEQMALAALPSELRRDAFFRAWVRKEALLKARGTGLLAPLEDFDVSLRPDEPARLLATRPDAADAARWQLFEVPIDPGWLAAVAVEAGPIQLNVTSDRRT